MAAKKKPTNTKTTRAWINKTTRMTKKVLESSANAYDYASDKIVPTVNTACKKAKKAVKKELNNKKSTTHLIAGKLEKATKSCVDFAKSKLNTGKKTTTNAKKRKTTTKKAKKTAKKSKTKAS